MDEKKPAVPERSFKRRQAVRRHAAVPLLLTRPCGPRPLRAGGACDPGSAAVGPGAGCLRSLRRRRPCNGGQPVRTYSGAATASRAGVGPPAPGRVRTMPSAASHRPAALCAACRPMAAGGCSVIVLLLPIIAFVPGFAWSFPRGGIPNIKKACRLPIAQETTGFAPARYHSCWRPRRIGRCARSRMPRPCPSAGMHPITGVSRSGVIGGRPGRRPFRRSAPRRDSGSPSAASHRPAALWPVRGAHAPPASRLHPTAPDHRVSDICGGLLYIIFPRSGFVNSKLSVYVVVLW